MDTRAVFTGLGAAKTRTASNYVRAGIYWAVIKRCKVDQSRKGDSFFAIEMQIVRVLDNDDGRGHSPREEVTHMLMTKHDSFLGNVKAFVANVLGLPDSQVGADEAVAVAGPDQPLTNTICEFHARDIMTRSNKPFTQIDYKREVPFAEAMEHMDPDTIGFCFPGDMPRPLPRSKPLFTA